MIQQRVFWAGVCFAACGLVGLGAGVLAQDGKSDSKGALPVAAAGDQIIVKREATRVIEPHKYRVSLVTEPIRSLTLTAPFDGVVRQADGKPGSKVSAQADVVRLDNTVQKLNVTRAEAQWKVASAELKIAGDMDDAHKALAQAKVDVAKAELDLAKYYLEQSSVRAPFAAELQQTLVTEGQFVKAGDPVAIIVDSTKMRVEVPVERSIAVQGKDLAIKIEAAEVQGKVEAIRPLSPRFEVLRDLFESVASAIVVVDNADGKFKPGQTVYVPLIPRQPIAEVPSSAIGNLPDGQRKVQVVRHMVVRDVPVTLLAGIGSNRLFVSGPFAEGDEVIYESSHQLADAFQLKPSAPAATGGAGQGAGQGTTPAATGTNPAPNKSVGF
jgi:multidrug efflux pump subunit AcrA (membrane-fusion protein)